MCSSQRGPKGIFSERFLDSSHIVCNFVGRSNSRQRQLDLTRRFNQQFPFAHVRMQSSGGRENNLIHQSESADMPTIAHLLVGRLYSLNAAAARYSLQVTGVAANTFDRLSKHIHRHPATWHSTSIQQHDQEQPPSARDSIGNVAPTIIDIWLDLSIWDACSMQADNNGQVGNYLRTRLE